MKNTRYARSLLIPSIMPMKGENRSNERVLQVINRPSMIYLWNIFYNFPLRAYEAFGQSSISRLFIFKFTCLIFKAVKWTLGSVQYKRFSLDLSIGQCLKFWNLRLERYFSSWNQQNAKIKIFCSIFSFCQLEIKLNRYSAKKLE